jgi:plastocyanin
MTAYLSRIFSVRSALLVGAAIVALAFVPRVAGDVLNGADDGASVREIRIVARDMTFYLEGQSAPNPTIHARPGERLRIVLRNTEVGMSHDFVIRSWQIKTRLLKGKGEDSIEFTVPLSRGVHVYSCNPHAEMMSGTVLVN